MALDRSGDPLYYVITRYTLPELPASTLNEVYESVKEAVETYYSYNRIPGCLDPTSPNFSPGANVEDGSCKPPPTNLTFGGMFQTCNMEPGFNNGNLCDGLTQVRWSLWGLTQVRHSCGGLIQVRWSLWQSYPSEVVFVVV